jgi:hypothetical protein
LVQSCAVRSQRRQILRPTVAANSHGAASGVSSGTRLSAVAPVAEAGSFIWTTTDSDATWMCQGDPAPHTAARVGDRDLAARVWRKVASSKELRSRRTRYSLTPCLRTRSSETSTAGAGTRWGPHGVWPRPGGDRRRSSIGPVCVVRIRPDLDRPLQAVLDDRPRGGGQGQVRLGESDLVRNRLGPRAASHSSTIRPCERGVQNRD